MNERIEQLAEQAGFFVKDGNIYNPSISENITFYQQKFAELIVRECASMARVYHSHEYDFTGDLELDEFMLKHFGVEE